MKKIKRGVFKVTKQGLAEAKPKSIIYKGIKVLPDNNLYKTIQYYGRKI